MTDVPPATTVSCPSCGVAVAVGYPKCPRCHAAVPQPPRARRQTFRDQVLAGGTSVAPAENGSPWMWAAIGVGALLVVGALALALRGDDKAPAVAPVEDDEVEEVEGDEEEGTEDGEDAAADDDEGTTAAAPPGDDGAAIRALSEALRIEQLWAKVRRDDDVVIIESSLCDDATMWPTVAAEAATLRGVGITSVQCVAPHGAVVFDRGI